MKKTTLKELKASWVSEDKEYYANSIGSIWNDDTVVYDASKLKYKVDYMYNNTTTKFKELAEDLGIGYDVDTVDSQLLVLCGDDEGIQKIIDFIKK